MSDLSTVGRWVYLRVPRRQFYCPNCQRYMTEALNFIDWKRRHTRRYEENIYQRFSVQLLSKLVEKNS